jgi:hypothetical protein
MTEMPIPGDLIRAFSVIPGRCFRMVYDYQLQHTHCYAAGVEGHLAGCQGEELVRGGVPGACAEGQARCGSGRDSQLVTLGVSWEGGFCLSRLVHVKLPALN